MTRRIFTLTLAGLIGIVCGGVVASAADSPLAGTGWKLVRFEAGDGTLAVPDDPAKYTLRFEAGGQLFARIDCNRGRGTWESPAASELRFGTMAVTRAMCPPGSLHDQILQHLPLVRAFKLTDGHLFLSLEANGGVYEFAATGPEDVAPKPKP